MSSRLFAVTGAWGFTGRCIARRLIESGCEVINITNHPESIRTTDINVRSVSYDFEHPDRLVENLRGVQTLFNTYWIRFEYGTSTFEKAVQNSKSLTEAAKAAGVERIVHISILNPSPHSPFPYYRGKAEVENIIQTSRISYAILRPAMIFGEGSVLINNLAWFLRRMPIFVVPGSGNCRVQPVYVEDLADLAIRFASETDNVVMDAVGPEVLTLNELITIIKRAVSSRTIILHSPVALALWATKVIGALLRDVILTRDEVAALYANLLVSADEPTCSTSLSRWLESNADTIGRTYKRDLRK